MYSVHSEISKEPKPLNNITPREISLLKITDSIQELGVSRRRQQTRDFFGNRHVQFHDFSGRAQWIPETWEFSANRRNPDVWSRNSANRFPFSEKNRTEIKSRKDEWYWRREQEWMRGITPAWSCGGCSRCSTRWRRRRLSLFRGDWRKHDGRHRSVCRWLVHRLLLLVVRMRMLAWREAVSLHSASQSKIHCQVCE